MSQIFEGLRLGNRPFALTAHLLAVAVTLAGVGAPARADTGTITGTIELPAEKQAPPIRSTGFVRRKANPIMPTRSYDPRRRMIVVLKGTVPKELETADKQPAEYKLVGESFEVPLFAVHAGRTVRLINKGRNSPHLRSKQAESVGRDCSPLNPDVNCDLRVAKPYQIVDITARGNPHLRGRIVSLPHPLFSLIDKKGNYKIENVPAGEWRIRIWYDTGWLDREAVVTVPKRRRRNKAVAAPKFQLPDRLTVRKPG